MRWKDSNQDEIIKVNKGLRDHDVTFEHLLCLSHLATVVLIHDHGDSPLSFFFSSVIFDFQYDSRYMVSIFEVTVE